MDKNEAQIQYLDLAFELLKK